MPLTVPGTPATFGPRRDSPSENIVDVAAAGAVSRYSTQTGAAPGLGNTIMNPPPPMFPAGGYVTAKAKAVATAASTAFPPCRSILRPASLAGADTETTMPRWDVATWMSALNANCGIAAKKIRPVHAKPVTPADSERLADWTCLIMISFRTSCVI